MTLQNQLDYLPSLLDGVVVPDGINADILKSNIMIEAGLRIPLYSEPETMKQAISVWFASRSWTFDHLLAIINAEYSPIENYDRNESYTRTLDDETDRTETLSGKDERDRTEKGSGSDTTERTTEGNLTETDDVSAFNATSYQPSTKRTTDDDRAITDELTYGKTLTIDDDITYGKKNTIDDNYSRSEGYTGRTHGNIGVTTNQQMIEQELALLESFNIYGWIAKQFAADLTLGVYEYGIF